MHKIRHILALVLCLGLSLAVLPAVAAPANSGSGAPGASQQSFYDRIMAILRSPPKLEGPGPGPQAKPHATPIFGSAKVSKQQLVNFIRLRNPVPQLACSVEELVDIYYEEAGQEGVRPDLAVAQALLETGFFRFERDVRPEQNNYCGLGTTRSGVPGLAFESPRLGVRAHIQHLLAYATNRYPLKPIVDPRFYLVRELSPNVAKCETWESLNGRWAIPGNGYGEKIVKLLEAIPSR